MHHQGIVEFEENLKRIFDEIDDELEDSYGGLYELHPARPERGETANKSHDGLFNVGASFTAGYGSRLGRGWVVEVSIVTLETVHDDTKKAIEEKVLHLLRKKLSMQYPEKKINVERDRRIIKIYGEIA